MKNYILELIAVDDIKRDKFIRYLINFSWLSSPRYNRAGTIHDFFAAMICENEHPIMSVQNAASWGYFNTISKVCKSLFI